MIVNIIRIIDCTLSALGLLLLAPVFFIIALAVKISSVGPVFYRQVRVGKGGGDFRLFKFRTMRQNADKQGLLTVGGKDSRVTGIGFFLRKYKLDELPQLLNVLKGEMSLVGPRPEVRRYVNLYSEEQKEVLNVLPGITDYASIFFRNENDLLASVANPEEFYIKEILPKKIELNFAYIRKANVHRYFDVIFKTILSAIRGK